MHVTRRLAALSALSFTRSALAQNLTTDQLNTVKERLAESALESWELGTRAQVLTALDTPSYSVLSTDVDLPPPTSQPPSSLDEVFDIAKMVVGNRSVSNRGATGPQPLISNSAAGDPPSVGVTILLANWTGRSGPDGVDYAGAAQDQLNFLLDDVPHTVDGAISHRIEQLQLWSDFVFMVPPFFAYYGVVTNNQSLVAQSYEQIRLYRQYLRDDGAGGLWKHMALGNSTDSGHWSTGKCTLLGVVAQRGLRTPAPSFYSHLQEMHGPPQACAACLAPSHAPNSPRACRMNRMIS